MSSSHSFPHAQKNVIGSRFIISAIPFVLPFIFVVLCNSFVDLVVCWFIAKLLNKSLTYLASFTHFGLQNFHHLQSLHRFFMTDSSFSRNAHSFLPKPPDSHRWLGATVLWRNFLALVCFCVVAGVRQRKHTPLREYIFCTFA